MVRIPRARPQMHQDAPIDYRQNTCRLSTSAVTEHASVRSAGLTHLRDAPCSLPLLQLRHRRSGLDYQKHRVKIESNKQHGAC